MNLIFFLHSFGIGGAERRCAAVADHFARSGHKVTVVMLDAPICVYPIHPAVRLIYLPENGEERLIYPDESRSTSPGDTIPVDAGKEYLKDNNSDLPDSLFDKITGSYSGRIYKLLLKYPDHTVISWVSLYSVSCAIALNGLPNRFIFAECNAPDAEFPAQHYFNELKRRCYPRAQAAIFQTKEQKDYYDYLPDTSKYIIPNPVPDLNIPRFEGIRRKIIATFCRLRKSKRIPLLIDAFALFLRDFPDYRLNIYGEGSEKEAILRYIDKLRLSDAISVFDFDIHIHKKIRDYAMFVSASDYEGMSNSMLEAMSIGLPVVCTDCRGGGAEAAITDGANGLLVPTGNAAALSDAMKRIAKDKSFSDHLSKNAVKIKDRFSSDRVFSMWDRAVSGADPSEADLDNTGKGAEI